MKFEGCAALVTGGGSGLGAGTARALAARGVKVAVLDLNETTAKAVAHDIGGVAVACDVADGDSMAAAIAAARAAHGPARLLINCAGVGTPQKAVGRDGPMPLENFMKVININLVGTFNAIRLAAADMQGLEPLEDGERGVIVNTASVAAFDGQIGQPAYAASKGGIVALTLPLAREFASFGIRVVTVAPGIFSTPMLHGLPDEVKESLAKSVPFPQRLGIPEDYAALAVHIIENRMLNGEVIRLDGAIRMAPR
ncbi:MAG: SDR family NAD(P)-dependent oxidoreductase [Alphaproteobacteria bacterium]